MASRVNDEGPTMDNAINRVLVAAISIIMICSVLIPIVVGQIAYLNSMNVPEGGPDISQYVGMIGVAVLMVIVGVVVSVVRTYTRSGE